MISALILARRHSPRQCNRLVARCHGFRRRLSRRHHRAIWSAP